MAKSKGTPSKGTTINLKKLKRHLLKKLTVDYPQSKRFIDKIKQKIKEVNPNESLMSNYNKLFCVSGDQKKYLSCGFTYYLMLFSYLTKHYPYEATIDIDDSSESSEENKKQNEVILLSDDDDSENNKPIEKQKRTVPLTQEQIRELINKDQKYQTLIKEIRNIDNKDSYERLKKMLSPQVISLIDKVKRNEYNYDERIITIYKTDLYSVDLRFINGKISIGARTLEDKK